MECDNEDDTTSNVVMELEEAIQMVDEIPNPGVPTNVDKVMNDQLLMLPSPRVSVSRLGVASMCMDQMDLLKKIDQKIQKEIL